MKKTNKLRFTIALLGAMAMLFSHCKKDEPSDIPITVINSDGKTGTVRDVDGNTYAIVKIGGQWWMAENLKTTKYGDGTPIEYPGTDKKAWEKNTTGAYAWHNNNISQKDIFGAFYNWYALKNNHGLCPKGWHVPEDEEWSQLVDYVVSQGYPNLSDVLNGAGNALKSCRQVNSPLGGNCNTSEQPRWDEDFLSGNNYYGFDKFGFSALPSGNRYGGGGFEWFLINISGCWWSATEAPNSSGWLRNLHFRFSHLDRFSRHKSFGYSVRCIRDQLNTEN